MISSKIHGLFDYLFGILLILLPWLIGFSDNKAGTLSCAIVGCLTIIYSLLTNYAYSLFKIIPFTVHLMFDLFVGAFLITGPWVMSWDNIVLFPLLIAGLVEISLVFLSWHKKFRSRTLNSTIILL